MATRKRLEGKAQSDFDDFDNDVADPTEDMVRPPVPPATPVTRAGGWINRDEPELKPGQTREPGPATIEREWEMPVNIAALAQAAVDGVPIEADSSIGFADTKKVPKPKGKALSAGAKTPKVPQTTASKDIPARVRSLPGPLTVDDKMFDKADEISDPLELLFKKCNDFLEMFLTLPEGSSVELDELGSFVELIKQLVPALKRKEYELADKEVVSNARIKVADLLRDSKGSNEEIENLKVLRDEIMEKMRSLAHEKQDFTQMQRAFEAAKTDNTGLWEKMKEAEVKMKNADTRIERAKASEVNLRDLQKATYLKVASVLILFFGASAAGYVYRGLQIEGAKKDPIAVAMAAVDDPDKKPAEVEVEVDKTTPTAGADSDDEEEKDEAPVDFPESNAILEGLTAKNICNFPPAKVDKMAGLVEKAKNQPPIAHKIQTILAQKNNCKKAFKRTLEMEGGDVTILSTIAGQTVNPEILEAILESYKGDRKIAQLTIFRADDKDGLPIELFDGKGDDEESDEGKVVEGKLSHGNKDYLFFPVEEEDDNNEVIGKLGRLIDGEGYELALRSAHAGFSYEQYLKKADSLEGQAVDSKTYAGLLEGLEGQDILTPVKK